jgi:hypothetical protein
MTAQTENAPFVLEGGQYPQRGSSNEDWVELERVASHGEACQLFERAKKGVSDLSLLSHAPRRQFSNGAA